MKIQKGLEGKQSPPSGEKNIDNIEPEIETKEDIEE